MSVDTGARETLRDANCEIAPRARSFPCVPRYAPVVTVFLFPFIHHHLAFAVSSDMRRAIL